jgi:hypothetical protein
MQGLLRAPMRREMSGATLEVEIKQMAAPPQNVAASASSSLVLLSSNTCFCCCSLSEIVYSNFTP